MNWGEIATIAVGLLGGHLSGWLAHALYLNNKQVLKVSQVTHIPVSLVQTTDGLVIQALSGQAQKLLQKLAVPEATPTPAG